MKNPVSSTLACGCMILLMFAAGALAQFDDPATCSTCHTAMTPVESEEWAASDHANSLETLGTNESAGDSCLACMSADYRMAPEDAKPTLEAATESVSCAACHEHNSGLEHNLAMTAAESCIGCHTMGAAEPGGSPHHPQAELFGGFGVAGVMDMPSIHGEILEETCVHCHMYKEGEEVADVGGHTFVADVKACDECHTDSEAMIVAMHEDMEPMLTELEEMLEAVPEEDRETDAYMEAAFNVHMVEVDGTLGVHNYSYAKAALGYAYEALGATAPITYNCETCHAGSVEYEEWRDTGHALNLVNNPPAGDNCLRCKAASDVKENPDVTFEEATLGIACNACHNHGSDLEHNLLVSAAENCMECHTMGTAAPGRSPHHSQREVFLGVGAAGVSESPSGHAEILEDTCAHCHMYKEGEEVAAVGGHTFLPDVRACEACHDDPEIMIAAIHEDVEGLLADLLPMLEAVPEEEHEADPYKEAAFNTHMIEVDKSGGVHNYSYAKAALGHAYEALGATAPVVYNCETCHAGSVEYKEWRNTGHALNLVNNPPSGDNCLSCKAASDVKQNPDVTIEEVTLGIACNACHNHGSDNEHNLIVSAAENCVECHTMGTAAPGRTPHHSQAEIFAGIGAAGVAEMESGHSKTMPDKCATCHMYKAGEEVATEGGHTFHPSMESCTGCHADGRGLMTVVQAKVTTLLEGLTEALEAVPEDERETEEYLEASFNTHMVEADASHGVHNSAYTLATLEYAYSALGVEMPDVGEVVPEIGGFTLSLAQGLNMISLPLKPETAYTARSFGAKLGATIVITFDSDVGRFVGFVPDHDGNGFPIEGGKGYIVNLMTPINASFEGTMWTNASASPPKLSTETWAFVMTGLVHETEHELTSSGKYLATVTNLRTGASASDMVGVSGEGRFTVVWADLSRKSVVEVSDRVEVVLKDATGEIVSGPSIYQVTPEDIERAFGTITMEMGNIVPEKSVLAQNYPNPFNPETWIPYQLAEDTDVSIRIYNTSGRLVRVLDLDYRNAGTYMSKNRAAYWDGRDENGEPVASGVYVYAIQAGNFTAVRKMVILK